MQPDLDNLHTSPTGGESNSGSDQITIGSKSETDWQLHIAIAEALGDKREAPWYGPWGIILTYCLFRNFCRSGYITVTYPQFPLTKDVDAFDPEDDKLDDDDSDPENHHVVIPFPSSPTKPPAKQWNTPTPLSRASMTPVVSGSPNTFQRPGAPSPEIFKGFREDLPETPPNPITKPIPPRIKRSTRLPDFAQLIYKLKVYPNGSLDSPPIYMKRIVLLVEIKRRVENPQRWSFVEVFPQIEQQARHAFASCPEITTLGVIIALGDAWTYREYERKDIGASLTFIPSTPPLFASSAKTYQPLDQFFGAKGYARLQDVDSDDALQVVRGRIHELCARLW